MKRLIGTIKNHLVPHIKKNPISLVTMTISFATLVYILIQIPYIKKYPITVDLAETMETSNRTLVH